MQKGNRFIMMLSITLCAFRHGTSRDKLALIKKLGFRAAGADKVPDLDDDAWRYFGHLAHHAPFIDLNLLSGLPEVRKLSRDLCLASVEWAANLGASTVTFHPGESTYFLNTKEADEIMKDIMTDFDRHAARHDLWACWETGTGYFLPLSKFEMIRDLGLQHTGICLDTGHLERVWRQLNPSDEIHAFAHFIRRFGDLIKCTHLHDWIDAPSPEDGWQGQDHHMIGQGSIDWPEFFGLLVEAGYDGDLLLEYNRRSYGSIEDLKHNIDQVKSMLHMAGVELTLGKDKPRNSVFT